MSQNDVLLCEEDFRILKQFAALLPNDPTGNRMTLANELSRATVVKDQELPAGCIRLNSQVKVCELATNKIFEFSIVVPSQAEIRANRISILTPMAAALIGLCEGQTLEWMMPAGLRKLKILAVSAPAG